MNPAPRRPRPAWMTWVEGVDSVDDLLVEVEDLWKQLQEARSSPGGVIGPQMTQAQFERLAQAEIHRIWIKSGVLEFAPPGPPLTEEEFELELVRREVGVPPNPAGVIRTLQRRCDDIAYRIGEKKEIRVEIQKEIQLLKNVPGARDKLSVFKDQLAIIEDDIVLCNEQYDTKHAEWTKIREDVRQKCLKPMLEEEMHRIQGKQTALGRFNKYLETINNDPTRFLERIAKLRKDEIYRQKSPWHDGREEEYFAGEGGE